MPGPNSKEKQNIGKVIDVLALLSELDGNRAVIFRQALNEGDWGAVFDEACTMQRTIKKLKALMVLVLASLDYPTRLVLSQDTGVIAITLAAVEQLVTDQDGRITMSDMIAAVNAMMEEQG